MAFVRFAIRVVTPLVIRAFPKIARKRNVVAFMRPPRVFAETVALHVERDTTGIGTCGPGPNGSVGSEELARCPSVEIGTHELRGAGNGTVRLGDCEGKAVNVACWACIGRVLDNVWTAVVVIGMCIGRWPGQQSPAICPNSHRRV